MNKYKKFYSRSPATLQAKIHYLTENGRDYLENIQMFLLPWQKIIERILKAPVLKEQTSDISKKYTSPIKKKYDEWMKEYKFWCEGFAIRRGRRLIRNV